MDQAPAKPNPIPDPLLAEAKLLTSAAVASTAEAQQLRDEVRQERGLFLAVLILLTVIICVQGWTERRANERSVEAREDIERTLQLIEECVSADRMQSDCQKRSNEGTGRALAAIAEANQNLVITAFQCARDPQNVDNAALELCITSQAGQVRD